MRFGIAIALLASVITALLFAHAGRQFAHQLQRHNVPPARDHESMFHAEGN